ncbi:MAG: hypothetical protein U5L09_10400 [Bacteroidales bacterium]|nr:hypothetical protein [Bacteroidales bacterium]
MAKSKQEIISDIENFINGNLTNLYVGISEEPRKRLEAHGVNLDLANTSWIYREAPNDEIAREVEKYFINKGTDGGEGGGDEDARYVYAYRKNNQTAP